MTSISRAQGRIVINEIMPWSGCNTTSEFIELMNFGPGPMNIGCYIVTNGQYSVTIPPNTIIQPRQYYVLAGQKIIPQGCGNADSSIQVDLNWTTCNCTNTPIPTTGDGFMQNGGSANEKIVLLDPNLQVVDAVSRNTTPSSSVSITTAALSGCSSQTFNLGTMGISYESINSSTGIDNSFARKVDGDCGWLKTTVISAHAPNKTGSTSSASYDFSTLSASQCSGTTGSISIKVNAADVNALFPMNYTLGFDRDSNEFFNHDDQYFYGADQVPDAIDIANLAYGRYRITVGSASGCNLKSFDFYIFNCYGVVLPVELQFFKYVGSTDGNHLFNFRISEGISIKKIVLEGSGGGNFESLQTHFGPIPEVVQTLKVPVSSYNKYRLRITDRFDQVSYSPVIVIRNNVPVTNAWPNPVKKEIFVQLPYEVQDRPAYIMLNSVGTQVSQGRGINRGGNLISIPTADLGPGSYYLRIEGNNRAPLTVSFIK